ncbi:hypothetical protein F4775DRAFT_590849 [Biscogniauxia sp. FL1348]|nr:hypothetical protein F4775DRAFT_590849 [Biscogniauxia sp. FL1348]
MHIQAAAIALLGLASTAVATYSPSQLNRLRAVHSGLAPSTVQARQAVSYATLAPACTSSALAIVDGMPYATGALAQFLDSFDATAAADADAANPTNLCAVTAALPASLRGPYSAYDQQASAWYAANSGGIQALLTSCGNGALGVQLTQAVSALQSYTAVGCSGSLDTPTLTVVLAVPTSAVPTATASSAAAAGTISAGFVGGLPPTTTPITSFSSSTTTTTNTTITDSATAASATMSSISQDAAVRPTGVLAGAMAAAGLLGAAMVL